MKKITILALTSILLLVLTACNTVETNETEEETLTPVTVQLKWFHTADFAGFYVADRQGYYREAGLDVTFLPGGPAVSYTETIDNGEAQIALARGETIIQANNAGSDYISIGNLFQQDPFVYMALREEEGVDLIQDGDDWAGEMVVHPDDHLLLIGILGSYGLTLDDIEQVQDTFTVGPLVDGEVSVLGGFITDRGRALVEQGLDVQFIRAEDFGILTYENIIFTTNDYAEANSETVDAFMRATLRGWQYALENRDDAISAVVAFDSSQSAEDVGATWDAIIPLLGDDPETMLQMSEDVFESTQSLMFEQGVISEEREPTSYFTNEFVTSE